MNRPAPFPDFSGSVMVDAERVAAVKTGRLRIDGLTVVDLFQVKVLHPQLKLGGQHLYCAIATDPEQITLQWAESPDSVSRLVDVHGHGVVAVLAATDNALCEFAGTPACTTPVLV